MEALIPNDKIDLSIGNSSVQNIGKRIWENKNHFDQKEMFRKIIRSLSHPHNGN